MPSRHRENAKSVQFFELESEVASPSPPKSAASKTTSSLNFNALACCSSSSGGTATFAKIDRNSEVDENEKPTMSLKTFAINKQLMSSMPPLEFSKKRVMCEPTLSSYVEIKRRKCTK